MSNKTKEQSPRFEIRVNGARSSLGDELTVRMVYANLTGQNFTAERRQPWMTGTHAQYLEMTRAEFGIDVSQGDLLSWGPAGGAAVEECRLELVTV